MKKFGKARMGGWLTAGAMVLGGLILNGCLKDDNDVYQISAVRALNAVPGSEQLDIFLDQNKLNFDDGVWQDEEFAYMDTLPYKNAWPNHRLVSVVDPKDYPNAAPLVQQAVNFTPGKFYSLYVVGSESVEVLSVEDDLSVPTDGKAKIRFIHLSPDAPPLDFEVQTDIDGPLLFRDVAFKEVTGFVAIGGGRTCRVEFVDHSSGNVRHAFEFALQAHMIYTVWVKGLLGNTADTSVAFGHGIFAH